MEFLLTLLFWLYGFQLEAPHHVPYHQSISAIHQHSESTITVDANKVYRKRDARVRTIVVVDDTIFRPEIS